MSLKHFHLLFIACSLALMAFILTWTRAQASAGEAWPGFQAAAVCGMAASLAYLGWFVRKYKTLS
jgi:hypothetical protein